MQHSDGDLVMERETIGTQVSLEGLPHGIESRVLPISDLNMHFLQAGDASCPLVLLLHGFPELAYSWRKVMLPIAEMGYHVVAPDQRGYGRTTVRSNSEPGNERTTRYEDDVRPYTVVNLVKDVVALVFALGHRTASAVLGHDFGSNVAAYSALIRPDVFRSVVMMSMPFPGPPSLPFNIDPHAPPDPPRSILSATMQEQLAALDPPRKYYMTYFTSPDANTDFMSARDGVHAFLRAYFHVKSADWQGNKPHRLPSDEPSQLAELPHYYMMPLKSHMPETVAPYMPSEEDIHSNTWLSESELNVYTAEYGRTGFQGGLNWYRAVQPEFIRDLAVFAEKKIEVSAMFLSGTKDWGVFQNPGALDKMKLHACSRMEEEDVVLIEGAGHWVQQEQPEQVVEQVGRFLRKYQE